MQLQVATYMRGQHIAMHPNASTGSSGVRNTTATNSQQIPTVQMNIVTTGGVGAGGVGGGAAALNCATQQQQQQQQRQQKNQQQQKQPPTTVTTNLTHPVMQQQQQQQQQQPIQHNNRLNHQKHQQQQSQQYNTQAGGSSQHMQKQRQHQNSNHNNSNNNSNNNNNNVNNNYNNINAYNNTQLNHQQHHHHQQQHQQIQQYNNYNTNAIPPPHHQRNMQQQHAHNYHHHPQQQQQQQQQPYMQPLKNILPYTASANATYVHGKNYNNNNNNNNSNNNVQKSQLLLQGGGVVQQQHHNNHYHNNNNNNNKKKYNKNNNYNNNNNNNNSSSSINTNINSDAPKSILQNPHRTTKSRTQLNLNSSVESTAISIAQLPHTSSTAVINNNNNNIEVPLQNNYCDSSTKTETAAAAATAIVTTTTTTTTNNTTPIVSAKDIQVASVACINANCLQNDDANQETNSEEFSEEAEKADTLAPLASENNRLIFNHILPNEDVTISKGSKEKTPMCLVNELARYNKIAHQYRLTSEKGPAHCKRFTVTLKLGDEEYSAEGFKIKKAQHMAAAEAIKKTNYNHPLPKTSRRIDENGLVRPNVTPTVELNALAMKLGQQTYYVYEPRQVDTTISPGDNLVPLYGPQAAQIPPHMLPPPPPHPPHPHTHPRMIDPVAMRRNQFAPGTYMPSSITGAPAAHQRFGGHRPMFQPKFRYPPNNMLAQVPPPIPGNYNNMVLKHAHVGGYGNPATNCKITLVVGKQKFHGYGRTLQQAKHDAAARALQMLKTQPAANQPNEAQNSSSKESDNKSPISVVHEIGIRRNMSVVFKVLREEGPAHMRVFITACIVGSIVTEGEGNGKKISKKRAAEKMLEELKKLPPITPTKSPVKRVRVKTPGKSAAKAVSANSSGSGGSDRRKRGGGSAAAASNKMEATNVTETDDENPITKLIQLQQMRKDKEPAFEIISKSGHENSHRREFIIEVTAQGLAARGTGSSKKIAKRNAAQNLLLAIEEKTNNKLNDQQQLQQQQQSQQTAKVDAANTLNAENKNINVVITANENSNATPAVPVSSILNDNNIPVITTTAGQVPGILILRQNKKHAAKKKENNAKAESKQLKTVEAVVTTSLQTIDAIDSTIVVQQQSFETSTTDTPIVSAANLTESIEIKMKTEQQQQQQQQHCNKVATSSSANDTSEVSVTNEAQTSTNATTTTAQQSSSNSISGVHMKDQLLYLANLLGFEVDFSDYPKGNHNDYLTIVTLSTNPPQICHGVGSSSEASRNDAAKSALKQLSELGLNNAKK